MLTYIIRRLLHALLVVFLVSVAVFLLVRAMPGDPIEMLYAENAVKQMTKETWMRSGMRWDWTDRSWCSTATGP